MNPPYVPITELLAHDTKKGAGDWGICKHSYTYTLQKSVRTLCITKNSYVKKNTYKIAKENTHKKICKYKKIHTKNPTRRSSKNLKVKKLQQYCLNTKER